MTVLIVYATVEGQTGKIARFVEEEVRKSGRDVARVDASDPAADISLDGVDTVILAAPVHERRHPDAFEVAVAAQRGALAERRTLMLSVSLSAAFPEGMDEAREYLVEMEMRTGFAPDAEALVAGAVRSRQYDYFATQLIRHVVLRDRDFDSASGEHEFTDWDALRDTVIGFLNENPAPDAA